MKKIYPKGLGIAMLGLFINLEISAHTPTSGEVYKYKQNQIRFEENQGQVADLAGNYREDVLYMASAPGIQIVLSSNGLSYYLLKDEKDPEFERRESGDVVKRKRHKTTWARFDMLLEGGSIQKNNIISESPFSDTKNYYLEHCPQGIMNVKGYQKLYISDVYPKIDMAIYVDASTGIKYDFILNPGANANNIRLLYEGAGIVSNTDSKIAIKTPLGTLEEGNLYVYNKVSQDPIEASYELAELDVKHHKAFELGANEKNSYLVTFNLGSIDPLETIVIDPPLTWGTLITGSGQFTGIGEVAIEEEDGDAFVVGYIHTAGLVALRDAGTYYDDTYNSPHDAYILKFDKDGVLLWGTYYGASDFEWGSAVSLDKSGNVYFIGDAWGNGLPLVDNGTYFDNSVSGLSDIFISKFSNDGELLWATFYGGAGEEYAKSIAVNDDYEVLITGTTTSGDFPVQSAGAFCDSILGGGRDAYILKFDSAGNRLWGTLIGGNGWERGYSITFDKNSNIITTGTTGSSDFPTFDNGTYYDNTFGGIRDAYILKFASDNVPLWGSYIGGTGRDWGASVDVDTNNNIFLMGFAASDDMPLVDAGTYYDDKLEKDTLKFGSFVWPQKYSDVFLAKFDEDGNQEWGTLFGGKGFDGWDVILGGTVDGGYTALDKCGNLYITFNIESDEDSDMVVLDEGNGSYFNPVNSGGSWEIYLAKFSNQGDLLWGTYFGGSNNDAKEAINISPHDNSLWMVGEWIGYNAVDIYSAPILNSGEYAFFDDQPSGGSDNGFVVKLSQPYIEGSNFNYSDKIFCQGDSSVIPEITGTPDGRFTIEKIGGYGVYVSYIDSATGEINISGLDTGTYVVTYFTEYPCPEDSSIEIKVIEKPEISIQSQDPYCEGDTTINLTANVEGGVWYGSAIQDSISGRLLTDSSTIGENSVMYILDLGACRIKDSTDITVAESPKVETEVYSICPGEINISVVGGIAPYSFEWSNEETTEDISGLYQEGEYTVLVTDGNGCNFESKSELIYTQPCPFAIFVPNAISPDGDGKNDLLKINGYGLNNFLFSLYNVYGKLIFQTDDLSKGWNASINGKEISSSMLAYTLQAEFLDGSSIEQSGNITVLR